MRITVVATVVLALALSVGGLFFVHYTRSVVATTIGAGLQGQIAVAATVLGGPSAADVSGSCPTSTTLSETTVRGRPQSTVLVCRSIESANGPAEYTATAAATSIATATRHALVGLSIGVPVVLALFACAVWLLVGRALRPVADINDEFTRISGTELHRRVPVVRSDDEIGRLAQTMNATLDELERSATEQKVFVANASHEIRSPLATARVPLEVALRYPELASWETVGRQTLAELDRLEKVATDLLLLAELDAGARPAAREVSLSAIVDDEVARRQGSTSRTWTVDIAHDLVVSGNESELSRLVANVLDNAERHATTSIRVVLESDARAEHAILSIRDDGPGIAPHARESVFERFTRLDEARDRATGGHGLGLSIARQIASGHNASLRVEDSETGALLRFTIPLGPQR